MLAFLSFADLLQHAAILSDVSEASALETVDALDKLGDALGDLAMGKRLARYTGQAARSLAKLVEIGCTDIDSRPELYASLHADLGIGSYETLTGFRPTSDYLGLIALRPTQT